MKPLLSMVQVENKTKSKQNTHVRFDLDVSSTSVKMTQFFKMMMASILIVLFLTFKTKILTNFDILSFLV